MVLKKVNQLTKERTELLGLLQKLDASTGTKLRIGRIMENKTDEQAERLASQLHKKIIDCKDESEVLARLFME